LAAKTSLGFFARAGEGTEAGRTGEGVLDEVVEAEGVLLERGFVCLTGLDDFDVALNVSEILVWEDEERV
jgi:hypothetical protein